MQGTIGVKKPVPRPIVGFILSLIGGLFAAAGGLYNLLYTTPYYYYGGIPAYQTYGLVGLASGAGILLGAALLYTVPRYRVGWGVLILVAAVASVFALYGPAFIYGFFGVPITLVGGSLGIAWNPPALPRFEDYRTCLACGRHIRAEYAVCPFCGTRPASGSATLPPFPPP